MQGSAVQTKWFYIRFASKARTFRLKPGSLANLAVSNGLFMVSVCKQIAAGLVVGSRTVVV